MIIQIALPLPVDRLFDYLPPKEDIPLIGTRVKVPYGHRKLVGIVVNHAASSELPDEKLKSITQILDAQPLFTPSVWKLLNWAAHYYQHPLGEVLHHALPQLLRQGAATIQEPLLHWQLTALGRQIELHQLQRAPKQQALLCKFRQASITSSSFSIAGIARHLLRALQKKGLLIQQTAPVLPDQCALPPTTQESKRLQLNHEQSKVVQALQEHLCTFSVWLLQGVTGSGKTEVYLRLLEHKIAHGYQALVLVPEISLTLQTLSRLRQRLNVPIVPLHSALNAQERLSVWLKARSGEIVVVVGTRSALFTPLKRLGLIVVDEEHDSAYKQQSGWRYHARDLAILRAQQEKVPILLCSATPALETLYNAQKGKYHHVSLTQRAGGAKPVQQHLLDLKGQKLIAGMAPLLLERIQTHLQAGQQVMLFLNRRGYAPILLCHDCGWLATCQSCERYYTLHYHLHTLWCHHCGKQQPIPRQCSQCGSTHLLPLGFGTERLEYELRHLFPNITIARIDRDTTRRKESLKNHLTNIYEGRTQLLIGTQILAKGHHFPHITLVALLNVDTALFSADYRAAERFAQLYTQVSGRAGREDKCGEVILQTHHPHHPLLQSLTTHGYTHFAQQMLMERHAAHLPPYVHHALLRAEDRNNYQARTLLSALRTALEQALLKEDKHCVLFGPLPALQAKRAGYFRWQLLLQHPSRIQLQHLLNRCRQLITTLPDGRKVKWSFDIDPIEF